MCVTTSPSALADGEDDAPVDVDVRVQGRHVVVRVTGELDHGSYDVLVDALSGLAAVDAVLLVVDLAACPFVGASPFRHLAHVATGMRRRGATLVVREPPASFRILNAVLRGPFRLEGGRNRR